MANIMESYRNFMEMASDPRTKDWWMMSGPAPLLTVIISYVYFSVSVGPRYMRDKKSYDLKYVMIIYNAIQVVFSAYLVYEGLQAGWLREYSFTCQPVDYSDSENGKRMANAVWWYFVAKIIELLDTVFFVLRKKNNQITFLHVYHHALMPMCSWIGVKFLPGGHGTLLGVINSFIHIIMYTYYLIAGLGPQYQKLLWWKKYVTRLQLVQFSIILIHNLQMFPRDCNYPKFIVTLLTINSVLFIYLFASFYIKTYKAEKKRKAQEESEHQANGKNKSLNLSSKEKSNGSLENGKISNSSEFMMNEIANIENNRKVKHQ